MRQTALVNARRAKERRACGRLDNLVCVLCLDVWVAQAGVLPHALEATWPDVPPCVPARLCLDLPQRQDGQTLSQHKRHLGLAVTVTRHIARFFQHCCCASPRRRCGGCVASICLALVLVLVLVLARLQRLGPKRVRSNCACDVAPVQLSPLCCLLPVCDKELVPLVNHYIPACHRPAQRAFVPSRSVGHGLCPVLPFNFCQLICRSGIAAVCACLWLLMG